MDENGNYELKLVDYDNSPGSNCWIIVTQLWDDSCKEGYHERKREDVSWGDCEFSGFKNVNEQRFYNYFRGNCCVKMSEDEEK